MRSPIAANETRYELFNCDGPYDLLVCSFGMMSRICKTAIKRLKAKGINVGLFRPITVKPFPCDACLAAVEPASQAICIELNLGQMLVDIKLAVGGRRPIEFYGRAGGLVPSVEDVMGELEKLIAQTKG